MKKLALTSKERQVLKHLELSRFQRRLTSKELLIQRRRRAESGGLRSHAKGKYVADGRARPREKTKSGYELLALPESLDLVKNFEETAEVIRAIRQITLKEKRPVLLDFTNVKILHPSALLLLLAEIHRCRLIHGSSRLDGTYPKVLKIERMLDATGFFKLLGVTSRIKNKPTRYPMEYVGFHSDIREVKGTVRHFRESLLGTTIKMSPHARRRLYRAVSEAMLNVGHHAYPKGSYRTNPEQGRWWLTGHVNRRAGELTVMFCDLGVGIAATLPKIYPIELIRAALAMIPGIRPNDAEMIQAGMEIGRTSTGEDGRGRGLNDLRKFVEDVGSGELHIFSRKGHFSYSPENGERTSNYRIGMGGTLITWTVPIARVTDWTQEGLEDNGDEADD